MKAANASKKKCAACGKEGNSLKSCTACKLVKYCNIACQKAHRPTHKKECRQRAAELLDESLLFKEPPKDDCPICFLPYTHESDESVHKNCCGKVLCIGCIHGVMERAIAERDAQLDVCPYCREQAADSDQEEIERLKKRIQCGDAVAFNIMGATYETGSKGVPVNLKKALEMWIRAGELGCSSGYFNAGGAYRRGGGVGMDVEKAKHYYGLAAMGGDVHARHNIGSMEAMAGNINLAIKHYVIAARAGYKGSLDDLKEYYLDGDLPKEEYGKILRAYQKSKDEMKSEKRDEAVRARNQIRAMGFNGYL